MQFKSDLKFLEDVPIKLDPKQIPQLYRASYEFAMEQTTIDNHFWKVLNRLEEMYKDDGFKYTSIDTRTHMLMKGMYPCIPGWHCDDFYRPDGKQPDLENVEKDAPQQHYLIVLGTCSMTEFLRNDVSMPTPAYIQQIQGAEEPVYAYYDRALEQKLENTVFVEPDKIYSFGPTAFHRGSPASENGFRAFIRVTRSNHREPKNEIRYQSNVYLAGRTSW